jgi:hypothetical protein
MRKIEPCEVCNFQSFCITNGKLQPQHPNRMSISRLRYKMTEKRQTSQGYIIRILQDFATKLWNITNFVMLFQAVMNFLSRSKF